MLSDKCDHCGVKPRRPPHPYCGKTCAEKAKQSALGNGMLCAHCNSRPRYVEAGKTHPYCSKTCARAAERPVKSEPTKTCLLCGKRQQSQAYRYYCGAGCDLKADKSAPALLEIPSHHADYISVEHQFREAWRHPSKTFPTVRHVYKVVVNPNMVQSYEDYRTEVEARGNFAGRIFKNHVMTEGNEHRRWHGTRRECTLGDPGYMKFCQSKTCSLCGIIQNSYNIQQATAIAKAKGAWERFGYGVYCSSTSSKSHDYARNMQESELKAMLLNHVVVGKGYKLTDNKESLEQPPPGYDSVLGEVSASGSLNYDEVVVYSNEAICPGYLVMYDDL